MRIVDVCEFYSPTGGGVRRYVEQKLEFGPRFGHEIIILAPGPETRSEKMRGGTIEWVKAPYLPVDRNYRMFWHSEDVWKALDRLQPDLVEGSSPWRGGWSRPSHSVGAGRVHRHPSRCGDAGIDRVDHNELAV